MTVFDNSILVVMSSREEDFIGLTEIHQRMETMEPMAAVLESLGRLTREGFLKRQDQSSWVFHWKITESGKAHLQREIQKAMNVKAELETPAL